MELSKLFESKRSIITDLGFPESKLPKLLNYIELLLASNEELNLISRKMTLDELLDNHIIDCLLPFKYLPKNLNKVADFGSGGGLPAVVYAIAFDSVQFHLFEKSPKKQEFLVKCRDLISGNIFVHGEIPVHLENFDLVTARGFKPIDVILDVSRSYYKNNGSYFLLKARQEKIDEEIRDSLKKFKDLKFKTVNLKSPVLDVERNLILIN